MPSFCIFAPISHAITMAHFCKANELRTKEYFTIFYIQLTHSQHQSPHCIGTKHDRNISLVYLGSKGYNLPALVNCDWAAARTSFARTPQLVCILRKLKTKPNGCLGRSASWANHCECLPNQTSDSFSIWIWHTILYNSRRPMLRSMQTSWGVLALVEIVIHNVEGDVKIDIIMTWTSKP